jgi:guanosine-3',5'-bis(diphosphate) 3'-pyrophosphohydrolase
MDLVNRALLFATEAHASIGQTRKYTGEPYIVHPIEVMMLVRLAGRHTDEMLAAALLHDVVEDTPKALGEIVSEFGREVGLLVDDLTEPEWFGNRAERKAKEARRLSQISPDAQTIKLADLISNSRTIIDRDPRFAKVYLPEKVAVLQMLTQGDRALRSMAWDLIPAEYDTRDAPLPESRGE